MSKLKVSVTQDHIDQGVTEDMDCCPVAYALRAAGCTNVLVGTMTIDLSLGGEVFEIYSPDSVSEFVSEFDMGGKEYVAPFDFELELPDSED